MNATNETNDESRKPLTDKQRAALRYGYELRTLKCIKSQLLLLTHRGPRVAHIQNIDYIVDRLISDTHQSYGNSRTPRR